MNDKAILTILVLVAVFVLPAAAAGQNTPTEPPFRVQTIDLQSLSCYGVIIDDEGVHLRMGDTRRRLARAEVTEVVFAPAGACDERPGGTVVETSCGDRLPADRLSLSQGKLRFASPLTGEVETDLAGVTAMYLPQGPMTAAQVRRRASAMVPERMRSDLLVVAREQDDWTAIDGVLKAIDDEGVTFSFRETDRRVKRENARAVLLSSTRQAQRPAGRLIARDGSTLAFSKITLDADDAAVETVGLGAITVPRERIAAVRFDSDKVVHLSQLEPAEVAHHGLFGEGFEPRRDVSAGGTPLRLDGRKYDSGLGLHSFCEISYDLGGEYRLLAAVVGIDAAVRPLGDATLTVLADGKPLVDEMRVTGTADATTLRVDVSGAKKLTIRVEFGEDSLDVSDHVNLAAARLIR